MENPRQILVASSSFISTEVQQLLEDSLFLMPNWKWIVLGCALLIGLLLRPFLHSLIHRFKRSNRWAQKNGTFLAHFSQMPIEGSLSWLVILTTWLMIVDVCTLPAGLDKFLTVVLKLFVGANIIRLAYIAVDAFGLLLGRLASQTDNTLDDQLVPFATKTLKVFSVVLGVLIVLQNLGVNVMSILAGLSLGGLALALAAQDTAANLFGSITILLDRPFQIGDWIKVGDTEGTVEEIGFRSTRIRTFYNSLITLPNGSLAKEKIDNMGLRPRRRIRHNIGITYETEISKIEEFCSTIRYTILQDPRVDRDSVVVAFNGYGDSALNVLVNFHIAVSSGDEEMQAQQKVLTEILKIAQSMGVEFAYPTRTLYTKPSP